MPAYKIVIDNQKVFLNTLHYFKNLIFRNKEPLSNSSKILLTVQENVDSVSTTASADTGGSFVSTEIYSENHHAIENPCASSKFSSEIYSNKSKKSPHSSLNKITPEFAVKQSLHESTPLKVAATK